MLGFPRRPTSPWIFLLIVPTTSSLAQRAVAQEPRRASKAFDPYVQASNRFGFRLLASISEQEKGENVLVSPASISVALGVAMSGAAGETQREMARCLELGALPPAAIPDGTAPLLRSIHTTNPGVVLEIATSLWAPPAVEIRADFLDRSSKAYAAEVVRLGPIEAVPRINAWVRDRTRGKIEAIVDQLPPTTALVIVNAVYFHGRWTTKFDSRLTKPKPFHLVGGGTKSISMMSQSGEYPYFKGAGFQAAALPYGDHAIRFEIVLPDSGLDLGELVHRFDMDGGWDWATELESTPGEVLLPRFTMEFAADLNNTLKQLGMRRAFDPTSADFSGITEKGGVWVGRVRHKSWLEVTEEGTEAAAGTAVEIPVMSAMPVKLEPFRLVVDRPFLFAIRDRLTGLILFLGAVTDPRPS